MLVINKNKVIYISFIILLGIMTAFGPLLSDLYTPSLPGVQESLNTTTSHVQLSLSIAMIGIAFGQFIFGPISDKFGKKSATIFIFSVFILTSLGCFFAPDIKALIILRFFQGLMGGGAIVIARSTAGDLYVGEKLAKFLSLLMVINGILTLIIPLISGGLLMIFSWKSIFGFLTCIGVLLLIVSIFTMKDDDNINNETKKEMKEIIKDFGSLLKTKKFIVPLLIQAVSYIMLFSYASSAPFILQKLYNFSPQQFSIFMSCIGIGLILSSQTASKLVDFFNRYQIILLYSLIQILGAIIVIVALIWSLPVWIYLVAILFTVIPVSGLGPIVFSVAMEERTGGSGNAASLLGLSQFIIGSIIAPLTGIKGAYNIYPYVIILITTIILISILMFINKGLHSKK
ncbi:multidrug effflux MFS transporter [Staphylococcus epidermidis]|uniref:multidrug effflux MFS transporter n=3 Tax=Staphylococcus epidermidis TaxID=1282 RepID=UPI00311FCC3F